MNQENEEQNQDQPEDPYFSKIDEGSSKRPECVSCGDSVKIVFHSGVPLAAKHCKDCYAELRWGKIPKYNRRRR